MKPNNQVKHTNRFSMKQTPKGYRNNIHYWNEEVTSKEQTPNGMEETPITAEEFYIKHATLSDIELMEQYAQYREKKAVKEALDVIKTLLDNNVTVTSEHLENLIRSKTKV